MRVEEKVRDAGGLARGRSDYCLRDQARVSFPISVYAVRRT